MTDFAGIRNLQAAARAYTGGISAGFSANFGLGTDHLLPARSR